MENDACYHSVFGMQNNFYTSLYEAYVLGLVCFKTTSAKYKYQLLEFGAKTWNMRFLQQMVENLCSGEKL